MNPPSSPRPYLVIFTLSGFAGLIYESIWSHYLKLFLGHAAYAQTLVLAIFMGGMALGSWICSRYSARWPNLLRGYALAEAAVGVAALVFHLVYVRFLDLSYELVLPAMGSPALNSVYKWVCSGSLILPQSILLGMTFPLMTAGVIRRYPGETGSIIALLYFTNSIGAAVGVLTSGFLLIAKLGLPGTLAFAGGVNLALAAIVWWLSPPSPERADRAGGEAGIRERRSATGHYRLLLAVALVTGAASFIYEVAWIRMLSMVLGSSTHAFELMLSAFITGIALGGLWIRKRIDRLRSPTGFLAGVQIVMGLLATATLPLYATSFEVMQWLVVDLPRTSAGYFWFNVGSHGIALAVMLPAAFCAGTTLPLITHALLARGYGERSIGAVYAWNTVGAILGVFVAIHLGMLFLGLKGLLVAGALLDIGIGVLLASRSWNRGATVATAGVAGLVLSIIVVGVPLEPHKMASGVFREGKMIDPAETEVVFHRDGKTATVSVTGNPAVSMAIRTNGKAEASLSMSDQLTESVDEHTMILMGALALALHPSARTAANIGMGSGLTTHTLLSTPQLDSVDTIEIEPAMVEGARLFGHRVRRAFEDPRSKIYFDDAKTFFSTRNARYDIIVSEPSNPWVGGVATLFSKEFYRRIKGFLNEDGLFIQWFHFYEMEESLVVSVLKAIVHEFEDFHIYAANAGDLIIVAANDSLSPRFPEEIFQQTGLASELKRVKIETTADLELRWLGNRAAFEPFIRGYPVQMNSDFFPVLDLYAVRSRFLGSSAADLFSPELSRLPVLEMLGRHATPPRPARSLTYSAKYERSQTAHLASVLLDYLQGADWSWPHSDLEVPPNIIEYGSHARRAIHECEAKMETGLWFDGMYASLVRRVLPFVPSDELDTVWAKLRSSRCWDNLDFVQRSFILMWEAVSRRDAPVMAERASEILDASLPLPPELLHHVVSVAVLGLAAQGEDRAARDLWTHHEAGMTREDRDSLRTRILLSHVGPSAPS